MTSLGVATGRVREPEMMDDPDLDEDRHLAALEGLARLNQLSGSVRVLWPPIAALARRLEHCPLRVLDLGSGAGDIPVDLWRKARRSGLALEIHGADFSPRAVSWARRRARMMAEPVQFHVLNVLEDDLPAHFDVVTCSLFLHHLDESQAVCLLRKMAGAAQHLVLAQDLRRCASGLQLARFAARVFTSSEVVRVDAQRSVRAAFTIEEAQSLAQEAGLGKVAIVPRWPYRFLLSWERQ